MEAPTKGNLALVPDIKEQTKICSNKSCSLAGKEQPLTNFSLSKKTKDGYRYVCKNCSHYKNALYREKNREEINKKNKEKYKNNSEYRKKLLEYGRNHKEKNNISRVKNLYKLTQEKYNEMLLSQNGGCAVCGGINVDGKRLSVDHNHECCPTKKTCGKCVRGLLCFNCNVALGTFDTQSKLRKAIEYLNKFGENQHVTSR